MILLEGKPSVNLCFLWLKLCIVNFKVNITNFEVNITNQVMLFSPNELSIPIPYLDSQN